MSESKVTATTKDPMESGKTRNFYRPPCSIPNRKNKYGNGNEREKRRNDKMREATGTDGLIHGNRQGNGKERKKHRNDKMRKE